MTPSENIVKNTIVLFRNDLRISDNPALYHAAQIGNVIPLFIYDTASMGEWAYGGASKYWLHHSLESLERELASKGLKLIIRSGDTKTIIDEIISETGVNGIYCLRNYEKWASDLEYNLHEKYHGTDIEFKRFAGNLLIEPEKLRNKSGGTYQVFTPFFKELFNSGKIRPPCPNIDVNFTSTDINTLNIADLNLLPTKPNWAKNFDNIWQIGADAAHKKLDEFLNDKIKNYSEGRDIPHLNITSLLSPHLHFGEISPAQIWSKVMKFCDDAPNGNFYKFLSEIGWREFAYYNLVANPKMPEKPINRKFENFEWANDENALIAWQKGQTGFPIIDAGMRELWQTGYMHNRVRMICASFLTKDLLINWQIGQKWFWDCLLDADLANNSCSWQWVSGCGIDAAPYFRIFNPTTQSQKFDTNGYYIKKWVPELQNLDAKYIHAPEMAPQDALNKAGIILGKTYPRPIINHAKARELALHLYKNLGPTNTESGE